MTYTLWTVRDHSGQSRPCCSWLTHGVFSADNIGDKELWASRHADVEPVAEPHSVWAGEWHIVHAPDVPGVVPPTGGHQLAARVWVVQCTDVPLGQAYRVLDATELAHLLRQHAASPPQSPGTPGG